jgi:hypothetical protein
MLVERYFDYKKWGLLMGLMIDLRICYLDNGG